MRRKWYLQTWFICLLFVFWQTIITPIIGIILLFMQISFDKKIEKTYGSLNDAIERTDALTKSYDSKERELESTFQKKSDEFKNKLDQAKKELKEIADEISIFEKESLIKNYNISDYDGISSEQCKDKLSLLKANEQEYIKGENSFIITSSGTKKEINDNKKQILRCFNTECDNISMSVSVKNIDLLRNKISKSFETLNKIFTVDGISLSNKILEFKLEQLNLVYSFELKKHQEKEQQKAIREQMIEEEKVRREIEKQKAKLEKDQSQCSNEISKLMAFMQKTSSDIEKQLYIEKINALEEKLSELENEKESVLEREANAKAGYVYVISNIGSFGNNIYKIGMTRRLEPMDRVKELSSASVPFEFDVHAMIFSTDAPSLEFALHKHFEKHSVNRINLRKEFFNTTLDEIEAVVKENYNNTAEFTRIPVALEYNQTLAILEEEKVG